MRSLQSLLLTGGAGFIGSSMVRELLARSEVESLIVLDALTYAGNRENLVGPDRDPRFHFVEGNINDRELVARLLSDSKCTGLLHLAAESHVDRSIERPSDFITTNVAGTSTLLDVARANKVPFLQCSTDEVYGSITFPKQADESQKRLDHLPKTSPRITKTKPFLPLFRE